MSEAVLSLKSVERTYTSGDEELHVLRGIDLDLNPGEIVGLIGPSGSGKSTLLHIAGLLEPPDAGAVTLAGIDAVNANDDMRTALRRNFVGFVYQFHHLLPEFDALENVALPRLIHGELRHRAMPEARRLLTALGLGERLTHRPAELSGGEQQRVAIARAFANAPKLILADEPTGNLDPATSEAVFESFRRAAREEGTAALVATHNIALSERMDRVLTLADGKLVSFQTAA
ncbi:ABC transporter ATP-binding protein [Hyphobacterium indicum]|uniref:ABC transporter ATP-binding protein n=1 Tax=Hyphobacterium indicum TaxID=2162714 RepID=UPI000D64EFEC|nr:ABC transporter ATP-binding protein [Hyphobacterium indicum]